MPRASTSRSTKRTSKKKTPKGISQFLPGLDRGLSLSPERKRDLVGLLLAALGLLTVLNWVTPGDGLLGGVWLKLLRQLFGWGAFAIPLALIAAGSWLVLQNFGERIPRPAGEQIVGAVTLYLAVLMLMQAIAGAPTFPEGAELARAGQGGGWIGGGLLSLLVNSIGGAGAVVALLAWVLVGLTLTAGLSVTELFALGAEGARRARLLFAGRRTGARHVSESMDTRLRAEPEAVAQAAAAVAEPLEGMPVRRIGIPHSELEHGPREPWVLPRMEDILEVGTERKADEQMDRQRAKLIEETLHLFGAPANVVEINRGPTITQFGVEPAFLETRTGRRTKVKVSKVAALADDLALALAAPSIRIEAPVPSKGFIGIEVPNAEIALVALRDVMDSEAFGKIRSKLRLGLGRDVSGTPIAADLTAMPHLLIAGTTGSGKSVCVNALVACLLLTNSPDDLRLLMIDPKRVELTYYNGIPHLLDRVVVDLERVVPALKWVSKQMDARYREFSRQGVRNIEDYNERMSHLGQQPMHYIAVVIDELADLMMMAPDETERVVTRLAQLARATGIHLIIATQRPSVDVVTGLIKANFPARIAFAVASSVDSRVIIDQPGAERLLGRGDMLFQAPDASAPIRMQGSFVSEGEMERIIRYWKNAALGGEQTRPSRALPEETLPSGVPLTQTPMWDEIAEIDPDRDELFGEAVRVLRNARRASISLLQRRLRIGYTRAARLIDQLEEAGIVGPAKSGSQAREVLDYLTEADGELTSAEGE